MSASNPTTSNTRVIVGLSGGVDSAVACARLLEAGYQVEGLFMKNWDEDDDTEYCTARADFADAEAVAAQLGIKLHSANFAAEYWDQVFEEFLAEYKAGRTPNPDVLCNREIKFKQFADYAEQLGADYIATGHYARLVDGQLCKAIDSTKDQTYFLQDVPIHRLQGCLFPLGELHKHEVRELAKSYGFQNHAKKDSTGICFIGERRFADFLARYLPERPGLIKTTGGRTLGKHRGHHYYTLGQRQGLGIGGQAQANEAPWYVVDKQLASNTLVVSQAPQTLAQRWLICAPVNWLIPPPTAPFSCNAKIRYRQADQAVTVSYAANGGFSCRFAEPQRAITPGQYICFYGGEVCLGGARIVHSQGFLSGGLRA